MTGKHTVGLAILLLVAGCEGSASRGESASTDGRCDRAVPVPTGVVTIRLEDEQIVPDTVRLKAGEPVELLVCNTGEHQRELLVGRALAASGFAESFFRGVIVTEMEGGVLASETPGRSPESPLTAAPADAPHAHANVAFLLHPGASAFIRFVPPPEKSGSWQMGSFREQRYDAGAIGAWIVE